MTEFEQGMILGFTLCAIGVLFMCKILGCTKEGE